MANVFDYLDWRGDLPFSAAPFSPPDNLILCCLSYVHFGGIVGGVGEEPVSLAHAAELFAVSGEEKERVRVPSDGELLKKAAKTRRFADLRLCRYVSRLDFEEEKQFAAVTFLLPDGSRNGSPKTGPPVPVTDEARAAAGWRAPRRRCCR